MTPERVLRDINTAANLDIAELFDEQKRLKSIHDMPLQVRRAIVSVEVVRRNLTAGDGTVEYVHKVKLIDKGRIAGRQTMKRWIAAGALCALSCSTSGPQPRSRQTRRLHILRLVDLCLAGADLLVLAPPSAPKHLAWTWTARLSRRRTCARSADVGLNAGRRNPPERIDAP